MGSTIANDEYPERVSQPWLITLTVSLLEVVPTLGLSIRRTNPFHLESFHNLIQQPVDDFKPCALVTPNGRRVSHVPRLPLQTEILEHDVG